MRSRVCDFDTDTAKPRTAITRYTSSPVLMYEKSPILLRNEYPAIYLFLALTPALSQTSKPHVTYPSPTILIIHHTKPAFLN